MIKNTKFHTASAVIASIGLSILTAAAGPAKKSPEELDEKIGSAQERLVALQAKAKKRIPTPVLANARGLVIMRSLKAGLGFGAEKGGGVAMVKRPGTDTWGPPVFVGAVEASWGLQIGAEASDFIIVLMSDKSLSFLKPLGSSGIGVEFNAAVGPVDVGEKLDTDTLKSQVLVYSDSAGAFAGATVKAGGIVGAKLRNMTYYGATMQEVLFGDKGKMTPAGQELADAIERFAGKTKPNSEAKPEAKAAAKKANS